jgi:hypothetical protein
MSESVTDISSLVCSVRPGRDERDVVKEVLMEVKAKASTVVRRRVTISCDECSASNARLMFTPHRYVGESRVSPEEVCNPEMDNIPPRPEDGRYERNAWAYGPATRQMYECICCGEHRIFGMTARPVTKIKYNGVN